MSRASAATRCATSTSSSIRSPTTFTALTAENERLRAGGAAPVVGSPDLDDVARQADEIIARARAEAARITGEAKAASAAAAVSASGPRTAPR